MKYVEKEMRRMKNKPINKRVEWLEEFTKMKYVGKEVKRRKEKTIKD